MNIIERQWSETGRVFKEDVRMQWFTLEWCVSMKGAGDAVGYWGLWGHKGVLCQVHPVLLRQEWRKSRQLKKSLDVHKGTFPDLSVTSNLRDTSIFERCFDANVNAVKKLCRSCEGLQKNYYI
ncbi:uncharacterized protein [Oscarella lobularis]|uniref:uncharacterized protein isoform X3 n=1 Tax=Oscarella lobularis TaxID=121494 RepID=UPI003313F1A7